MLITKQGAKYEYKCKSCGADYVEQRNIDEAQFFTTCHSCGSEFELVSTTEFTYEQEIADPIVETPEGGN